MVWVRKLTSVPSTSKKMALTIAENTPSFPPSLSLSGKYCANQDTINYSLGQVQRGFRRLRASDGRPREMRGNSPGFP